MNDFRRSSQLHHPAHHSVRSLLRSVGPLLVVVGLVFILIGGIDFFASFNRMSSGAFPGRSNSAVIPGSGEMVWRTSGGTGRVSRSNGPTKFWCLFVGMPLLAAGVGMTKAGYKGAIARYSAGGLAPVGVDTLNYVADGAQDGVQTVVGAVVAGLREGADPPAVVVCHQCKAENGADSKFCDQCGEGLAVEVMCGSCEQVNDADARFCQACGTSLSAEA